ncbi:MAG: hypothetical protein QG570_94 [Patescibacteria group bacterium]|nr:hypothetical protein [Patescibacteria group bacterium]
MKTNANLPKEMLKNIILTGVVAVLSFTLLLVAILPFIGGKELRKIFPTFTSISQETNAATPSPFTVSVSKDKVNFSSSILIPVGSPYYLKTNPVYNGYLEVKLVGSSTTSKWNATDRFGIAAVSSTQMASITPGSYIASFRPWVDSGTNPYAWSNQVNVFVSSITAKAYNVSVSKDGKSYSSKIEINVGDPYYLKMDPPVFGYYESRAKGSTLWNKWNFANSSGIATATKEQMARVPAGTYTSAFRPWTGTIPNPYSVQNEVTVVVKAATSGTAKSTTLACTGATQPNVSKMLNVGTWNIGGLGGGAANDALLDSKAVVVGKKFKELGLDVLIVQEVHKHRQSTTYGDPATKSNFSQLVQAQMSEKLYFYAQFQDGSEHSLVTISKFPIIDSGFKEIPGKRKITYALVDSPAGKLKVFNTHLQRQEDYMCPGMDISVDYIKSKLVAEDRYIVGGDFNAQYDSNGGFFEYAGAGKRYCTYDQSFVQIFATKCTSTLCDYSPNSIDFILGGTASKPAVYQYCRKEAYGLLDAHEIYLSTVTL